MSEIRVLQVVTLMNRGGLESMIMNYYRNIDRNKIQFDFLEHREGKHDFTDEIISLGGNIYTVPAMNPLNTNGYLKEIDYFFKNSHNRYQIVHSHLDCMSSYPLKFAKKYNIPVRIAHSHTINIDKDWKYLSKIYSKAQIKKYATHLFACSNEAGKFMFKKNEFDVIKNAIDVKRFEFNESKRKIIRKELKISDKFVIGHVGRFNIEKNHELLINIFKKVKEKVDNAVLVLVGGGELRKKIETKVKDLNLGDSVIFTGVCTNISELLLSMDVFVFPSLYEGLGIAVIEAQASGLPCVISDRVPREAHLTNQIEILSLTDSVESWVKSILKFNINYKRYSKYNEIKLMGYDVKDAANRLECFYLENCIKR